MRRLVTALLAPLLALVLIGALAPVGASAQDIRVDSGMGPDGPGTGRPPSHRPRPPFVHRPSPFIPCCVGWSYPPTDPPPPVIVAPPPPIVYVVPTGPSLAYVPTPRVEPAPEVQLATGRWERHGNGKEYPYTWVWVGAAGTR